MLRRLLPVLGLLVLGSSVAFAQTAVPAGTSDLMLSWRSNGFAPGGYTGRAAASGGGTVLLVAQPLVGGRPADVSRLEIRWYLNDEFFDSGIGMDSVTIPIGTYHQDSIDVRVQIVAAPFDANEASISVPLTDPQAVIELRSGTELHQGQNSFMGTGYSFNVTDPDDLVYSWTIDGQVPQGSEDPRFLNIAADTTPTAPVDLTLSITHPQNEEEGASTLTRIGPRVSP